MIPGIDYVGVTTPFYCHDGYGNMLFGLRGENCRDEHGRWDPGSGELEHGLTFAQNILKEVKEEYGCQGEISRMLPAHPIFRSDGGRMTHWIAVPAFVRVPREKVIVAEPEKIVAIEWRHHCDFPSPLHEGFSQSLDFLWMDFTAFFQMSA